MDKELNEIEKNALDAVNASVNPHGFMAVHMETIDEEIWFTLWFIDETKRKAVKQDGYFEACYYTKAKYGKDEGYIAFGIMDGEWVDLFPDPAKSCGIYARWSQQMPLEKMIEEAKR